MNAFRSALWAEALKARRSKITPITAVGFLLLPFAGGLLMIVLKYPEQARAVGLLSTKAQLTAGVADWPTFWSIMSQGTAMGGAILFTLITSWVFGREFSDHTVKELLALPTPRWVIVAAKFALMGVWFLALSLFVFVVGMGVGAAIGLPGWSADMGWSAFRIVVLTAVLTILLMPFVALFASSGRGYLPPMGWLILTVLFAQILSLLGYGDWFPWAVPVLTSGMVKTGAEQVGLHSYLIVLVACLIGIAATIYWWQHADQTK